MAGNYKVAHMLDSTNLGGAERIAINLVNTLVAENLIDASMIVSRKTGNGDELINKNVPRIFLDKKNTYDLPAFLKLYSYVKENKIQILHAHTTSIYWALLVKLFRGKKLKLIWHDHHGFRPSSSSAFNARAKIFSKWLDAYICVSEPMMQWAHANLKLSDQSVFLLINFPELIFTGKKPIDVLEKKGNPTILCVSNYRPEKGQAHLVRAFRQVLLKHPGAVLWICGKNMVPSYKSEVFDLVKSLGIASSVFDLDARIDIGDVMKMADIGVLASEFEGLPVSLLEYGLAGLPVICTSVGQVPAVLCSGEFGLLVPPKNVDLLAKSILRYIDNDNERKDMADKFQKHVMLNYSKTQGVKKLYAIYEKILG